MSQPIDIQATTTPAEQQTMALEPAKPMAVQPMPQKQESYEDLMGLAKQLVTTGFLPAAIKTPAQAVAIILTGRELGLPPMQALRSICIIQGKPELAADLQLSLFKRSGGQAKWLQQTSEAAELWLRHPNGDEFTQAFTMEDARRAGLASGVNWQKYPQAMLRSRAITAGLKSLGFEPLCGCYAPGEIGGPEVVEHHESDKLTAETPPPPGSQPPRPATRTAPGGATPPKTPPTPPKPPVELPVRPIHPAIFADITTRQRMIDNLAQCADLALEYFRKLEAPSVLLPNETLADLPLERVPVTQRQFGLLMAAISDFGNGEPAAHAFPPNPLPPPPKPAPKPKAETKGAEKCGNISAPPISSAANAVKPPPSVEAAQKKNPEWWWDVICPVPPRGMKRNDYMKSPDTIGSLYDGTKTGNQEAQRRLFGFLNHFEPKGWVKRDGTEMPPSQADKTFRDGLDGFGEWHEKHGQDTNAGEQQPTPPPVSEPSEPEDNVPF